MLYFDILYLCVCRFVEIGGYKKICVNLRSHSIWLGGGMDIRRGLWQRKKNQQLDVSKIAIHEPKK